MRIILIDRKKRVIRLVPETKDDLWVVEKVISKGDFLEGVVKRREKKEGERGEGVTKTYRVLLEVERAQFHEYSGSLRVVGRIVEAQPEDIGKGRYQTMEIVTGKEVKIHTEPSEYVVDLLKSAERDSARPVVTLVSIDDEEAVVYTLSQRLERRGVVRNKHRSRGKEGSLKEFFGDVLAFVENLDPDLVIVGGPTAIYDAFVSFAGRGRKRFIGVRTSVSGEKGIYELISSRVNPLLEKHRLERISSVIDEFNKRISKGEPVAVGEEVDEKAYAAEVVLIHECFFLGNRERSKRIMDTVLRNKGKVYVVPRDFLPGSVVEKLGGRIALLRFKC